MCLPVKRKPLEVSICWFIIDDFFPYFLSFSGFLHGKVRLKRKVNLTLDSPSIQYQIGLPWSTTVVFMNFIIKLT